MPKRSRSESPSPLPPPSSSPSSPSSPKSTDQADPPTHSTKYVHTSLSASPTRAAMKCSLPPHAVLSFTTFADFENHYAQAHTNRCSSCHRNFPTEHFLSLHISENHDPLEQARKAKGEKTYRCFVDGCEKVCSTPQKRRMHLTDKHVFPKSYDFSIVNDGIDKRSSMLRTRHRRASSATERAAWRKRDTNGINGSHIAAGDTSGMERNEAKESPEESADALDGETEQALAKQTDIDHLTSSMSALKFVPSSIRFGRGGRRGGFSRS